jgi:hypothetical protein
MREQESEELSPQFKSLFESLLRKMAEPLSAWTLPIPMPRRQEGLFERKRRGDLNA